MVKVIDGQVIQMELPETGYLSNGQTVSGYNLLPSDTLLQEGWLPLEEDKPGYDPETQSLVFDSYEILADRVIAHYIAV